MDNPHCATCCGVIRGIDFYPTVLSQCCISTECVMDRNVMQCVVRMGGRVGELCGIPVGNSDVCELDACTDMCWSAGVSPLAMSPW